MPLSGVFGSPRKTDRSRSVARVEQCGPVAGEDVVEQFGEPEAVAPEPLRALDVGGDYRSVVDSWHGVASIWSKASNSTCASIATNFVPLYGN